MYKINDQIILETSRDGLQGYITILAKDKDIEKDKVLFPENDKIGRAHV